MSWMTWMKSHDATTRRKEVILVELVMFVLLVAGFGVMLCFLMNAD